MEHLLYFNDGYVSGRSIFAPLGPTVLGKEMDIYKMLRFYGEKSERQSEGEEVTQGCSVQQGGLEVLTGEEGQGKAKKEANHTDLR